MGALVIADHDNSELGHSTLNVVTAAKELDAGDVDILVFGHNCDSIAQECAKISGISKVLKADTPEFENFLAENCAQTLKSAAESYTHILGSDTTFSKNVLPRASALLDCQQISGISAVVDSKTFERPIYAGNAIATVQTTDDKVFLTIRSTSFDPAQAEGGSASVEDFASQGDKELSSFVSRKLSESERPELTAAGIVVSGGRGLGSGENFDMIEKLADKLGAAVGASRAAVDAGYISNDHQVGQTGKVVAPDLYIAVGISGAIQHLAGMKDSKVIVAINKDEEAPIFQIADYGLAADLFEAVPEMTEKLN